MENTVNAQMLPKQKKLKGVCLSPCLDLLFLVRLPDTYTRELGTENTENTAALFLRQFNNLLGAGEKRMPVVELFSKTDQKTFEY
jgi:hypothetical protein